MAQAARPTDWIGRHAGRAGGYGDQVGLGTSAAAEARPEGCSMLARQRPKNKPSTVPPGIRDLAPARPERSKRDPQPERCGAGGAKGQVTECPRRNVGEA